MRTAGELRLGLPGFEFADLHEPAGLARLFANFRARLAASDAALSVRYEAWLDGGRLPERDESELLIAVARAVSAHLVRLFGLEEPAVRHRERVARQRRRFDFRKRFVAKRVARRAPADGDVPERLEA